MVNDTNSTLAITGVILAGGKGARIGRDKAFLTFSGRPLIETVLAAVSPLVDDTIIITNTPALYADYHVKVREDLIRGAGPLGGACSVDPRPASPGTRPRIRSRQHRAREA